MATLTSDLRRQLENVCIAARELAETAARSALQKRAVDAAEPFPHFTAADKELRTRLRARGRQAGDIRNANKSQAINQLTRELAYEYWHRMLFARFLAENNLLMHPDGVAVSLEECVELASNADPPAANGFVLAARYASRMLPQIFRTDDVLLEIEFAPEQRLALEKTLASLPKQTFEADDSLGWVYQFWQTAEKKRVNDTGDKIDGRTLPAVTQLFTEHYMVEFLLHNTIGAWWCARNGVRGPPSGAGTATGQSPIEMRYLRWRDDGIPAAGKFDGWPRSLAEFILLDPCCGSGHFLVAAFNLLVPLRMRDEGLTAQQACDAVLRNNLFGLELDPRCTQIAAFALAVAAWKYPDAGGYRPLPSLNIACSGQGVTGKKEEWLSLASGEEKLRNGIEQLYDIFKKAADLGSLIDPQREKGNLYQAGYAALHPLLAKALKRNVEDADLAAVGVAAQGIVRAAEILSMQFTLVATNVPYLAYGSHAPVISDYLNTHYNSGKADLATAFTRRCQRFVATNGTAAVVTPQNWLYGDYFEDFRAEMLDQVQFLVCCMLGPGAFSAISGEVVKPQLLIFTHAACNEDHIIRGCDLNDAKGIEAKVTGLLEQPLETTKQSPLKSAAGHIISFANQSEGELLSKYVDYSNGIQSGDFPRFGRQFWEVPALSANWSLQQTTTDETAIIGGLHNIFYWQGGKGEFVDFVRHRLGGQNIGSWIRGTDFLDRKGVAISPTGEIKAAAFWGTLYDDNTIVLTPKKTKHLPALLSFCLSEGYAKSVRALDKALKVRGALVKVRFDLAHWQAVAAKQFPNGLPEPHSDDPTQWPFRGEIPLSRNPLQVAVARMLGYHWPEQPKTVDAIDKLADSDGILCLPSVRGEAAAAERLLEVLRTAYDKSWSESLLQKLLTDAGCKPATTLDDWLRNKFFEQHFKRFHHRPFIWHIWDSRNDGFSCLVNYHKLTHKTLENLTYSYVADWIKVQAAETKAGKVGADLRLVAAHALQEKLKLILAGEPPYDIFVRWKPLSEQSIGWNPDLNGGVRMNIRPFIEADILRKTPNIKWTKDRGKEPERDRDDYPWFWNGKAFVGDRVNDVHLSNAEKLAANAAASKRSGK